LITGSSSGSLKMGCVVGLIDLIRWEVGRIDIGIQFGFERGTNAAKSVKFNTAEEFVILDLISADTA
jgi:hypothetical protein